MKLERIKCKPLERAKNFCISKSYIVGCTGQKATVLDKQLNLIHTVEKLEYVYAAQISPDESKLLLISNANKFYIVDMHSFEMKRVTVKAPYNANLEGRGCWSFDGESVWIPVQHRDSFNSTIRRYYIDDLSKYEDFLTDKYCLMHISQIKTCKTYFLMGFNRKENDRSYFIYFDGIAFREYPVKAAAHMIMCTATVDMEKRIVTVTSIDGCRQFTLEGENLKRITHPDPKDKTRCFSDVFIHLFADDSDKQQKLREESAALGLEEIPDPDDITKYAESSCGKYIYLSSRSGFYLLDANDGGILAFVPEEFGVQNFAELLPNVIVIATWTGVKLYRLC